MAQAVEAVTAHAPFPPLQWHRIRVRLRRQRGVESRVEAGDDRQLRAQLTQRAHRRQRRRIVQRRQLGDLGQLLQHVGIHHCAAVEIGASVHHPHNGGVEVARVGQERLQRVQLGLAFERLQVFLRGHPVVPLQHAQLQRAGSGIDYQ